MALFVVNLTADVVVEAESASHAHGAVYDGFGHISFREFGTFVLREVKCEADIPDGYGMRSTPINTDAAIGDLMGGST